MNVTLTEEMKDMLRTQLPILATVTDAETPNIGPKRTLRAYDESSLIFNENTAGRHLGNIRAGSRAAVAVVDREAPDGYRFLGRAEVHESGPVMDDALAFARERGMSRPKAAVLIRIEEIFSLKPGEAAGKRV
jgi:predicted pyridoxine 5'-phosphate oxidase superfamily flavin-nucleotide-binding protein